MRYLLKYLIGLAVMAVLMAKYPPARAIVEAPIEYAHGVATGVEMFNLQKAIHACKVRDERYPTREELSRYVAENFRSRGRSVFNDSWNTTYGYESTDNGFELRSAGPDKQMGTADDLVIAQQD